MKLKIILTVMTMLATVFEADSALDTSKLIVNLVSQKPYVPTKVNPEDRRKLLPLFPRNSALKKFVMSTETPTRISNSENTPKSIKKPSLRKFVLQTTTETTEYVPKSKLTRPSLMKAKKFVRDQTSKPIDRANSHKISPVFPVEDQTVKSIGSGNNRKSSILFPKLKLFKKDLTEESKVEIVKGGLFSDSFEVDSTGATLIDESAEIERTSQDLPFTPFASTARKHFGIGTQRPKRESDFDQESELRFITNDIPSDVNFVEEFEMDKIEFIFLNGDDAFLSHLASDEETDINDSQDKYKRSIIEEEVLTSTISSYAFTGRDMQLKDEIIFWNINE